MKIVKIEELPSGSYRIRKTYKGKTYAKIFDHMPTEKEAAIAMAELMQDDSPIKGTFEKYAKEYIKNREGVISPASTRTYLIKLNQLSEKFRKMNLYDISSETVQREISLFAKDHAPKTTKTLYGFISSIMAAYRPNLRLRIKLPQTIVRQAYEPTNEDIRHILEASKGTEYSIAFQLGVFGLRRAEIASLDISDLTGNELRIHRSKVYLNGEWITKESPKTDASNRTIFIPDNLKDEILSQGYIFKYTPPKLNEALHRYQKKLNIPHFRFHDLRHYFASYAHSMGISDADILAIGGWETDFVMKKVYRRSMEESKKNAMQIFSEAVLS